MSILNEESNKMVPNKPIEKKNYVIEKIDSLDDS